MFVARKQGRLPRANHDIDSGRHFGFQVDDNQEVTRRIKETYPEGAPKEREATYAEGRGSDPDGNLFDISTVGWGVKRRMNL